MKLAGNLIHLSKRTLEVPKYISAAVMRMLFLIQKPVLTHVCFIEALEKGQNTKIFADRLAELSPKNEKRVCKARKQYTELMAS